MTQNAKKWVRRVYFALATLALVVIAVCLMVQCVAIYRLGANSFTRESIAAHFAPIALPIWICVGVVAVGFALYPLLPAAPDSAPDRDAVTLRRLQGRTDLSACPADLTHKVCKARRARNTHHFITLCLLAVGAAVFLWYGLDIDHFPKDDPNGAIIRAMMWLLPCVGVPGIYGLFTAYFCRRSVRKEIDLLRTAPKEAISAAPKTESKNEKWLPFARGGIVAVAVGCIVYGLLVGGAAEVLGKALKICTECIGLG